ncbi:MAG: zinc ABC transporter substrate-binding protein [Pirellulales bacterium]|nr:zinc ABC transporter substrate-binding protein [Pirellulales bacterium]
MVFGSPLVHRPKCRRAFQTLSGALALFSALSLLGCGSSASSPSQRGQASDAAARGYPYTVVTTTAMVTDIVRIVAGDNAKVTGLMGEGVDPHLYKPTRNDVRRLMDADIVFYSGLMLEGRMSETFTQIARTNKPVYAVTAGIDKSSLLQPAGAQGHWDPHVWMDVSAWSECVGFVAERLAEFDPPHADAYRQNAAAYRAELEKLDGYVRRVIAGIPEQQRVLITAHDAFEYFSRAYSIPVRSIQGISTESEAGVNDINRLVDFIVERKIKAIFVESSVSQQNIRAVVEGAAQKGWEVAIGGQLFSDAMGRAGTYEGTYIGMIDHNATTIARSLGGEAPEKGFLGKLQ